MMFELYRTNPKSPADSVEKLYLRVVSYLGTLQMTGLCYMWLFRHKHQCHQYPSHRGVALLMLRVSVQLIPAKFELFSHVAKASPSKQ